MDDALGPEALSPELERLRAEIAGLRAEISAVRSDIGIMKSDVAAARGQVSGVDGRVSRLADSLGELARNTSDGIASLAGGLGELGDQLRRAHEIRTARDRRGDLEKTREERFGRRKDVRELAANLIHIVGTGSVDERVVLDAARRRMMDVPDYWLSPAVIAVASWLSDDQDRCATAIAMALQLDQSRTALFMTLLLRGQADGGALSQWLSAYLSGLVPASLPPELPVVTDAAASGALGSDSASLLMERLNAWYQEAARSPGTSGDPAGHWQRRLRGMGKPAEAKDFPMLARSCSAWEALRQRHQVTTALEAASAHFPDRFSRGADVTPDLAMRISSTLQSLAQATDAAEEEVNREVSRLETFLSASDGAAGEQPAAGVEADSPGAPGILPMVDTSAFPAPADGKWPDPTVTELVAIAASASLIAEAAGSLDAQAPRPASVMVRVGRRPQRTVSFEYPDARDAIVADAITGQAAQCKSQVHAEISAATTAGQGRLRLARRLSLLVLPGAAVLGGIPFVISTGVASVDFAAPAAAIAAAALGWLALLPRRKRLEQGGSKQQEAADGDIDTAAAELARMFEQDRRGTVCREELAGYLSGLSAADVRRATRFTSPSATPGPRAFPAWTPLPTRPLPPLGDPGTPP
jgi:hypothetical protein